MFHNYTLTRYYSTITFLMQIIHFTLYIDFPGLLLVTGTTYEPNWVAFQLAYIIILEHKTPRAYTKTYVGIVRIGVRISRLAILTTKYTLHTSIPCHVYNSLTLKVFFTAFDANTILYDSNTYSIVQKQLLHSQILPRKRARRARSARLVGMYFVFCERCETFRRCEIVW